MLREINSHVLINLKITAHQFIIMMILLDGSYGHLDEYLKSTNSYETFNEDLSNLAARSFVSYDPSTILDLKSIVVMPSFMQVVAKYNNFDELYATYPSKISRPDGSIDYLRKDRKHCEQVYSIISKGNRDVHEHIMNCLRAELAARRNNNSMQYMKRLGSWLTKREWENFADIVDNNINIKEVNTYGTALE